MPTCTYKSLDTGPEAYASPGGLGNAIQSRGLPDCQTEALPRGFGIMQRAGRLWRPAQNCSPCGG